MGSMGESEASGESGVGKQLELMRLADLEFALSLQSSMNREEVWGEMMEQVKKDAMTPYYLFLVEKFDRSLDEKLVEEMKMANQDELQKIEEAIKDAADNMGEMEVRDAYYSKAKFFERIGDRENSLKAMEEVLEKTVGTGKKIDVLFDCIRIGMFWNDSQLIEKFIEQAKERVEKGGDWDRRNRLKVYEALFRLSARDFKEASNLLLESIATFTCTELFDYKTLVWFAVVSSMISVDRVTLKEKLVSSPDVLSVIQEVPNVQSMLNSFYSCDYATFLRALVEVMEEIRNNRFLATHHRYYIREIRVVAYSQFLQSYRSVTLASMAKSFGVSQEFLDKDLSQFIAAGRIICKIDRVNGIVETNRLDSKNSQYQSVVKQGDLLLNRIQKLSRVIT